jgi:hypothetical protein
LGEKRTLMKFLQFSLDLKESAAAQFAPAAAAGADAASGAGSAAASAASPPGVDGSDGLSAASVDAVHRSVASPESPSDAATIPASVSGSLRSLNERVLGLGRSLLR